MAALAALATLSVLWADDVKLLRMPSMPESKILHKEQPPYPPDAVDHHIYGVVKMSVLIGTDGHVERIRLVSGHKLLAPAAMQAVRNWVFAPTEEDGHPVKVMTQIAIPFDLDGHGSPVTRRPSATVPIQ
jgi:TonB family protein